MDEQEALLFPETEWPTCSRCHAKIPQFRLSSPLGDRLFTLLAQGRRTESVLVIRNESGCDKETAKTWVAHHGLDCFSGETPVCPYCGNALRTPRAKQCRSCGRDWHLASSTSPDPPTTFDAAEQLFREFLVRNGYPSNVRWLVPDNVVPDKSKRYWIREDNGKASAEAHRRYVAGLERNLGISLRAICSTDTTTFATIFVPADYLDAQHNLMGRGLKLSCPTEAAPACTVVSPIRWFLVRLRYGRRTRMLEL
jgi:hypothetical protein